jgi:hypothetical protein
MKMVKYHGEGWRFLTDAQFDGAIAAWQNGLLYHTKSTFGDLLPAPRSPAGTPPEHQGLEISWCYENGNRSWIGFRPCWIGIRKPAKLPGGDELSGAEIYVRQMNAEGNGYWAILNVRRPHVTVTDEDTQTDEVRDFFSRLRTIGVDEAMSTDGMRDILPWDLLRPSRE